MSITVKNSTKQPIHVSINYWEGSANTGWFAIQPKGTESWGRDDMRGFVMSVNIESIQFPYFVQAGSEIEIFTDKVTDHKQPIGPINRDKKPLNVAVAAG